MTQSRNDVRVTLENIYFMWYFTSRGVFIPILYRFIIESSEIKIIFLLYGHRIRWKNKSVIYGMEYQFSTTINLNQTRLW